MLGSTRWIAATAGLLAVSVSAACGQAIPLSQPQPVGGVANNAASSQVASATSNGTPAAAGGTLLGSRSVEVKRSSIAETLSLDGVVVAEDSTSMVYPGRATVVDVDAEAGQAVKQGDTLLTVEAPHHMLPDDVSHSLQAAQAKLQASQAALQQAVDQTTSREQAAASRAEANDQLQQQAMADATSALRRAQDNLAKVQSGASSAERQAARNGVDSAQAALQAAQAARDAVAAGPDADAVRAATRDVTNAQIGVSRAQADLDTLTRGPDPSVIRTAQAQLQRSQTQLQLAQAARPDPKLDASIARLQQDQAVQDAQFAVDTAQASLVKLKLPPSDSDVQAAKQRVQDAQDSLAAASTKLDTLNAGPDQRMLAAAQAAVDNAQRDVTTAKAHVGDVNAHPTAAELTDAQDQIRKAQATVDNASRTPALAADPNGVDIAALQSTVQDDQAKVDGLQETLDATGLPAPFDATVVAVRVKPGDSITSTKPVFILAAAGSPTIVRVDLGDDEAARVTAGQQATIRLSTDSNASQGYAASVAVLTPAAADGTTDASADFQVSWPEGQAPKFGASVQVGLTVQQKDGVLVVPTAALRLSGSKASVEVLSGTLRKLVNVQVGIKSDTSAEIVSGLTEGQMVLVGTP